MNEECVIRTASREDLVAVKCLDDLAFGEHQGITLDELEQLLRHGGIFILLSSNNLLIGESQVLLSTIPELPHQLAPDEAHYYGTAIHPDYQGNGYGRLLADKQDEFAVGRGKKAATLTLRVENYASMSLRFNRGFVIVDYLPDFYGPSEDCRNRLLLSKRFCKEPVVHWEDVTEVPVCFSNAKSAVDLKAHEQVQKLLSDGYKGFSITKDCILFGRESTGR